MFAPLKLIFDRVVAVGNLEVIDSAGNHHRFGEKVEIAAWFGRHKDV